MGTPGEATGKVKDADAKAKRAGKEPRGRIEARLESLARMYEARKSKKTEKEETDTNKDTGTVEE